MNVFRREAAAAALALVLSLGCRGTATGPAGDLRFFPLAVGNSWVYAPEDSFFGQPIEWRVADRQGDTVRLVRPAGGSHPGTITMLDHGSQVDLLVGDEGFQPFYAFEPGASWVRRDPWECDDGAVVMALEEPNTVVTPAGAFSGCLRIERRTTVSCTDAGTTMEWWAPGVGLVKWEELNFYAGGPLTFRLVSYTVE